MDLFEDSQELTDHKFKLKGGRIWTLSQSKYNEWMKNLSQYDVEGEIRKAKQWILDNKRKRKSPKGMHKFLSSWIMRSEETGHVTVDAEKSPAQITYEKNVREKIELFGGIVHERTKAELRANKTFMYAYNTYPEFREWAGKQVYKTYEAYSSPEPIKPDITEDLPPPSKKEKLVGLYRDVERHRNNNPEKFSNLI